MRPYQSLVIGYLDKLDCNPRRRRNESVITQSADSCVVIVGIHYAVSALIHHDVQTATKQNPR